MVGRAGMYHKGIGADHHHKGTGQAGNKSILSYRADIGVPGYTGYIPSSATIPLPIKGSTEHTGKPGGAEVHDRMASTQTEESINKSLYTTTNRSGTSKPYAGPDKKAGGYWIQTDVARDGPNKPFIAGTTYKNEVCETSKQPELVEGNSEPVKPTVFPSYTTLNAMKTCKHDAATVAGKATLGYHSQYTSMVVKDPLTGGLVAAGSERPASTSMVPSSANPQRHKVMPHCVSPKFDGTTVYAHNYGVYGSDPLSKSANNEVGITARASTGQFNAGTTRSTEHIPGYSGFIPLTDNNPQALTAAAGAHNRNSAKDGMLLSALDQFSRHTLPQNGLFRPQVPKNIHPTQPPTLDSTQGWANNEVTKVPLKPIDNSNFHQVDNGTMSFFTAGTVAISDNGVAVAERYFHTVRPKEGLPRIFYPSKTTNSGYGFPH